MNTGASLIRVAHILGGQERSRPYVPPSNLCVVMLIGVAFEVGSLQTQQVKSGLWPETTLV